MGGQQIHENVLNITNHQENANQTIMRCHLKPLRMAFLRKTRYYKCCRGYGKKREPWYTISENEIGVATLENSIEVAQKKKTNYQMIQQYQYCVYIQRK